MKIDLSSFKKSVKSLQDALRISNKLIKGKVDTPEEKFFRSGVIKNFEFTYELSWKTLQRWIGEYHDADIAEVERKELFRIAYKYNLIENVENWFKYHEARNITSHTYDEDKADSVFETTKIFSKDVKKLLKKLEELNNGK